MELEIEPVQPPEVAEAIVRVLRAATEPDPWWQAGLEEALRNEGPVAEHPRGGAGVVEP
jgi:hypothetical protein